MPAKHNHLNRHKWSVFFFQNRKLEGEHEYEISVSES